MIMATFTGAPVGGLVGGQIVAVLLPHFGWRVIFILGGAFPLALVAILAAWLPESPRFLARKPNLSPGQAALLQRLGIAAGRAELRYGDEVRDEAEYFKGIKGKPDREQRKQLASLVAEHTQHWSPSLATDPVEQALGSMITAKQKRERPRAKMPEAGKGGNVIDLMAVLKKSLQGGLPQRS